MGEGDTINVATNLVQPSTEQSSFVANSVN